MFTHCCRTALCAVGLSWLVAGHAQIQTADTLTFAETARRVAERNPSIMAYAPRRLALDSERASAHLNPPLELGVEADEFVGTGNAQGLGGIELTLALSSVIELGDRPSRRTAFVDARESLLAAEERTRLLDSQAEAARLFVRLAALQQELVVARAAKDLAHQAEKTVRSRVNRGRSPEADLQRAMAATARAQLAVGHVLHQLPTLRVRLAALWGMTTPDFTRVDDDALFHPGRVGDFERLASTLDQNPDLQQLASRERIAAASLRLAQSTARGDLRWRAGLRRQEGSDSTGLVAGISIPLFSGRRAQNDVSAATSRRDAAALDTAAARINARATLYEAWQHRQHAIEAFAQLRDAVIPRLESALADTHAAYRAGRYSYLELIAARQELIDARLALVDAARRAHLNRIELERLAGAALTAADGDAITDHKDDNHDH
ncbi:MAG: TolC family protein [Pseudomonadota bacterium]|nr:TolC family protein [Pseudomonadota bacterium]